MNGRKKPKTKLKKKEIPPPPKQSKNLLLGTKSKVTQPLIGTAYKYYTFHICLERYKNVTMVQKGFNLTHPRGNEFWLNLIEIRRRYVTKD